MTIEGLGFMKSLFDRLKIPYQYKEWTSTVPKTYFVGEYIEVEGQTEDGLDESTFNLTGTTMGTNMELEIVKDMIKKEIGNGLTAILEDGSGIAVCYLNSLPLPSVDHGVHRLQINLKVKEWKV